MIQTTAERLMGEAFTLSEQSPDPYVKVGAMIVDAQRAAVLSTGVNYIAGLSNNDPLWQDRKARRSCVTHAEVHACITLPRHLNWFSLLDMYVTHIPCTSCLTVIAATDVSRIFWRNEMPNNNYGGTAECERVASILGIRLVKL